MKFIRIYTCAILMMLFFTNSSALETIVIMRHAEKPTGGLGQLTCQGLNRAIALPKVLLGKFKKPEAIFAPNPHEQVNDGRLYYYVRPLATIEPTAIRLEMPVNTAYGFSDTNGLTTTLLSAQYHQATVFVTWEHLMAVVLAQNIVDKLNGRINIPAWENDDYDSLYILTIDWKATSPIIYFQHDYQGLSNLSTSCPV